MTWGGAWLEGFRIPIKGGETPSSGVRGDNKSAFHSRADKHVSKGQYLPTKAAKDGVCAARLG